MDKNSSQHSGNLTINKHGRLQIRIPGNLHSLVCRLAFMSESLLSVSDIIRKCAKWINAGNSIPESTEEFNQRMQDALSGPCSILLQARDCDDPGCDAEAFRKVIAYRCLKSLKSYDGYSCFSTDKKEGQDFFLKTQEE